MNKPGFRLAVSVCRAAADKLQRHVCQYFTDIIVEHAENQNYEEISDAHEIIKHINRSCPSLLHNVVPQLEEELRMDDAQLRLLATQVLGDMFGDNGGKDLMRKYNNTWEFWLTRRNDRDVTVRITWVEAAKSLILHNDAARTVIEGSYMWLSLMVWPLTRDAGHMNEKLFEPDEKVRAAVCKVYSQLDYEAALHYVSVDQLSLHG
jgi:sister-chromatid-cohesion protein PDS5